MDKEKKMTELIVLVSVFIVLVVVGKIVNVIKCFKQSDEFKALEKEIEEEEAISDQEDNDAVDFLFIGGIGTILFVFFGLFTGELIYYFLVLFIITAVVFVYYLSTNNRF